MLYLDFHGLSHFWDKIVEWLSGPSSGLVHSTGNETISGRKTFHGIIAGGSSTTNAIFAAADEGSALGAAVYGAAAAGRAAGGYDTAAEAARAMGSGIDRVYAPIAENVAVYDALYREYHALHEWFGRGGNDVMKRLKAIRTKALGK